MPSSPPISLKECQKQSQKARNMVSREVGESNCYTSFKTALAFSILPA